MRTVAGQIVFPENAPKQQARTVSVEVHDMGLADAPSKILARTQLKNVRVGPNGRLKFKVSVPELQRGMQAFRVHVDWDGDGRVSAGDLLTTQVITVPAAGETAPVDVPVTVI